MFATVCKKLWSGTESGNMSEMYWVKSMVPVRLFFRGELADLLKKRNY